MVLIKSLNMVPKRTLVSEVISSIRFDVEEVVRSG